MPGSSAVTSKKLCRKTVFVTFVAFVIFVHYLLSTTPVELPKPLNEELLWERPACKIYEVDPFEPSVQKYFKPKEIQQCRKPLIYSSGEVSSALLGCKNHSKINFLPLALPVRSSYGTMRTTVTILPALAVSAQSRGRNKTQKNTTDGQTG